jgi:hypothetical protein
MTFVSIRGIGKDTFIDKIVIRKTEFLGSQIYFKSKQSFCLFAASVVSQHGCHFSSIFASHQGLSHLSDFKKSSFEKRTQRS